MARRPRSRSNITESSDTSHIELPPWVITSNRVGSGSEAVPGREVTVHYTGWLYDPGGFENKGPELDCSRTDNRLRFQLGAGEVNCVWEEGVAGMKVGGRCTLIIAPEYGDSAKGLIDVIPPQTAIVFDLELLDVR